MGWTVGGDAASAAELVSMRTDLGVAHTNAYMMPAPTGVAATDEAALDAAFGSGSQVIVFSWPGTYVIDSAITSVVSNTYCISTCAPGEVEIKAATTADNDVAWLFDLEFVTQIVGCGFYGIKFNGNRAARNSNNGAVKCGLFGWGYSTRHSDITFEECIFTDSGTNCVKFYVDNLKVLRCLLTGLGGGGMSLMSTEQALIEGNTFYNYNTVSPVIQTPALGLGHSENTSTGCSNVIIARNKFYPLTSEWFGIEMSDVDGRPNRNIVISNNVFDANQGLGTGISGGIWNSTICGNTWRNFQASDVAVIEITGSHNTVSNNSIRTSESSATAGWRCVTFHSNYSSVVATGNQFCHNTVSVASDDSTSGYLVTVQDQYDFIMIGNSLHWVPTGTASGNGVVIQNVARRHVIKDNVITRTGTAADEYVGGAIKFQTGTGLGAGSADKYADDVVIDGNVFYNWSQGIDTASGNSQDTNIIVSNNRFRGCFYAINNVLRGKGFSFFNNVESDGQSPNNTSPALKAADYTATLMDKVVLFNTTAAARKLTLPAWPSNGQEILAKRVDSGTTYALNVASNATPVDGVINETNVKTTTTAYDSIRLVNIATSMTATMTIADPCVVTVTGHALVAGQAVVFATTGALPTGITAGTIYYAGAISGSTFKLYATSAAGVTGGTSDDIATSGSQSGTHSCNSNAWWSA